MILVMPKMRFAPWMVKAWMERESLWSFLAAVEVEREAETEAEIEVGIAEGGESPRTLRMYSYGLFV